MKNELTPAQASYVTGIAIKSVNKAIENREIPATVRRQGRIVRRYIPYSGLVCLQLNARGLKRLPLRVRRDVFRLVVKNPNQQQIRYNDALIVDVRSARSEIEERLAKLRKLTRIVTSDPDVMGGASVFRGTRIPVYSIAEMLDAGANESEILSGYPALTAEMIALSRVYARTFPRRGRPISQPWHAAIPVRRKRGKLSAA